MADLYDELVALLGGFEAAGVEYALCGALALAVHGAPRATKDIDLIARREDADRVRAVARECGFVFEALPMSFASVGIEVQRFTKLVAGLPLMLDVLWLAPVLQPVWETREHLPWRDRSLSVVSRDGLITLKLTAGRPQDLVDVQRLAAADGTREPR